MGVVTANDLSTSLVAALPDLSLERQRVGLGLLRALAQGRPVSIPALAGRLGLPPERVAEAIDDWPGTVRDEAGAVVGYAGLSLAETAHRFEVDRRTLFTWCAWDSLFLPELLGEPARVRSSCPATGRQVALEVAPDRVAAVDPRGAVVSFVAPDGCFGDEVRSRFCSFVHFISSREAAESWVENHPGTFVVSVAEACEVGRVANRAQFGDALSEEGRA